MRTIKDVRFDLKQWGDFWARQENGQGYASKSNVQMLKKTLQLVNTIQETAYQTSHKADNIHVPEFIQILDKLILTLPTQCKIALRQRYTTKCRIQYFDNEKTYLFWVRKAEKE